MRSSFAGLAPLPLSEKPTIRSHCVPGLTEALLSISDLTDLQKSVVFLKDKALILTTDGLENHLQSSFTIDAEGVSRNRLYYLPQGPVELKSNRASASSDASLLTWHHRLSHLGLRGLLDLRRKNKIFVNDDDQEPIITCEDCVNGNFNRINLKSREMYKASQKLEIFHSYLLSLPSAS